ncbi:MAG: hypothetical protein FWF76_05615 [Oscillospiraceae bacterium]|nr:hypothetical protein [Oscillospiraceae bacterium]
MDNCTQNDFPDTPELAAMLNTAAAMLCKGKSVEEIEVLASLFQMFTETIHAIARVERRRFHLREFHERKCREREAFCKDYCESKHRSSLECEHLRESREFRHEHLRESQHDEHHERSPRISDN